MNKKNLKLVNEIYNLSFELYFNLNKVKKQKKDLLVLLTNFLINLKHYMLKNNFKVNITKENNLFFNKRGFNK